MGTDRKRGCSRQSVIELGMRLGIGLGGPEREIELGS